MIRYYLWYLPHNHKNLFKSLDLIDDKISIGDYVSVWQDDSGLNGNINKIDIDNIYKFLEQLFYKFNMELPKNFAPHSMSVGDIVELRDIDSRYSRYFFCDNIGFKEVTYKLA